MERTLKQIADELKIDKQAVYRYVRQEHFEACRCSGKTMYYADDVYERIKVFFLNKKSHQKTHHNTSQEIDKSIYEALLRQLETKDQQIAELQRLLDQEQQLNAKLMIETKPTPPIEPDSTVPDPETPTNIPEKNRKWWKFWK